MTATVAGAETGYGDQPFNVQSLHGIDQDASGLREQRRALKERPRGDVDAERLDNHVDVSDCLMDRVAIESIAGHRLQTRILDGYACRRTRQRANAMASPKGSLDRKSVV